MSPLAKADLKEFLKNAATAAVVFAMIYLLVDAIFYAMGR